jgi:hypothetical protein
MTHTNSRGEVLEVGSIISAYRPGYHIITDIVDRSDQVLFGHRMTSPLIHYMPLLNAKGGKAPKSPQVCDAAYCRLAGPAITEKIAELKAHIAALVKFQESFIADCNFCEQVKVSPGETCPMCENKN